MQRYYMYTASRLTWRLSWTTWPFFFHPNWVSLYPLGLVLVSYGSCCTAAATALFLVLTYVCTNVYMCAHIILAHLIT